MIRFFVLDSARHRETPGRSEREERPMNTVSVVPSTADILPLEAARS